MKRHGFTLIELLVVLAILGLLAALLFPVFAKVRENGRRTVCLSNGRQIGMGIMQYAAENDSFFPNDQSEDTNGQWAAQVYPFLRDANVYHCPDDPTAGEKLGVYGEAGTTRRRAFHYFADSYGINSGLIENVTVDYVNIEKGVKNKVLKPAFSEAALTAPAKTALLFEVRDCTADLMRADAAPQPQFGCAASGNGTRRLSDSGERNADGCSIGTLSFGPYLGVYYATGQVGGRSTDPFSGSNLALMANEPRHNGGANYLACDGHVIWLRPGSVSGGQSQPVSGAGCGQDDLAASCGGKGTAAGTANGKYALTFSVH